jgi:acyl transferase domain-containing protein
MTLMSIIAQVLSFFNYVWLSLTKFKGTLNSFLSGRLSYCLGLSGPSLVVDTACSSSIVALHQASRALMNRDCASALVGAVNIISSPDVRLFLLLWSRSKYVLDVHRS